MRKRINKYKDRKSRSTLENRRATLGVLGGLFMSSLLPARAVAASSAKLGYLPVNAMTAIYADAAKAWSGGSVDVQLLRLQGGPAIVQAIQGGSIQCGEVAVTVLLSLASRQIPIVCLAACNAATKAFPYNRIMVPKESPLKSVADLRGKSVGMLALGTLDHVQLLAALKAAGVGSDQVKIVSIPVPNQPQALASKQVDAMVMPPPADAMAELSYGARTLADATDSLPYYPLEMLIADARWVEQDPTAAEELVLGWIKACRWIEDNKAQARGVAKSVLNLPADIAERARLPQWSRNCLPTMPGVWNLYNAMVANKIIEPSQDPEAMMRRHIIDPVNKILLPALKKIGQVPDKSTEELRNVRLPYLSKGPEAYLGPWER